MPRAQSLAQEKHVKNAEFGQMTLMIYQRKCQHENWGLMIKASF